MRILHSTNPYGDCWSYNVSEAGYPDTLRPNQYSVNPRYSTVAGYNATQIWGRADIIGEAKYPPTHYNDTFNNTCGPSPGTSAGDQNQQPAARNYTTPLWYDESYVQISSLRVLILILFISSPEYWYATRRLDPDGSTLGSKLPLLGLPCVPSVIPRAKLSRIVSGSGTWCLASCRLVSLCYPLCVSTCIAFAFAAYCPIMLQPLASLTHICRVATQLAVSASSAALRD